MLLLSVPVPGESPPSLLKELGTSNCQLPGSWYKDSIVQHLQSLPSPTGMHGTILNCCRIALLHSFVKRGHRAHICQTLGETVIKTIPVLGLRIAQTGREVFTENTTLALVLEG